MRDSKKDTDVKNRHLDSVGEGKGGTQDAPSHLSEWPSSKRTQITNVGEVVEKREPSHSVGGSVSWCS